MDMENFTNMSLNIRTIGHMGSTNQVNNFLIRRTTNQSHQILNYSSKRTELLLKDPKCETPTSWAIK